MHAFLVKKCACKDITHEDLTLCADFAIVDEAYPYVAKMLLTDDSPRLRASLKYMVSCRPPTLFDSICTCWLLARVCHVTLKLA